MRHRKQGKTLGRKSAPRKALMRNLVTSLVIFEHVDTTIVKAKLLRSDAEKLITVGKENTLTSRRRLLEELYTKKAVDKVLEVLGPRYKDQKGGYTRITRLGQRKGDGAEMARIEFIS